jgi:signal transduction histidine kinase/ligand-binding sensor protein
MSLVPVEYKFSDLIDIKVFDQLLDHLYEVAQIPSAIIDMEGNVLTGAGWQRICIDFHRKHPDSEKICITSDTHIHKEIESGEPYVVYECPHGLVDSCCPIIIEGEHVANVFTGQMLHEPLTDKDIDRFKNQAKKYGFNEQEYINALNEVPVYPIDKHKSILDLLSKLAEEIAKTGLSQLRLLKQQKVDMKNIQRFQAVLDSLDALVYVADIDSYEVLFVNKYGIDLLGGRDFTGKICWQSIQTNQEGPCDFCTNKYIVDDDGKPTGVYEWEFQNTKTGKCFSIKDRAIEWIDGRIVRLEIATDISRRKEREEEKAILERQLLQSQKMEAVGTMAGGIAHDFNNILGIVMGNADLALNTVPQENPATHNLDSILQASKRAKNIVKQLLSFSRSEEASRKPYYLCRLVQECMNTVKAVIPSSVKLSVVVPIKCEEDITSCLMVDVDPNQIYQVLMNLCVNAVQAMSEVGNIEVCVAEVTIDDPTILPGLDIGTYERLTVTDTGKGVDESIAVKVFDPFFTTKAVNKGTGMGLSVVHGIVEEHGGKVFFDSEPGVGTTVSIYLPAIKGNDTKTEEEKELLKGSENILLVDDEISLLEVESHMMRSLGYAVTPVSSSTEALEVFSKKPDDFDLIILDQTMPNLTGVELAKKILQLRPQMPIILCTGFSNLVSAEEAKEIGIKAFCMKPLEKETVSKEIRNVLS